MTSRPGLQTRPGNVHKHPGKVVTDLVRKRRSPAQVAAEKAAIALKRAQEEEERAALIEEVDEIERRLRSLVLDEMVRMKVKFNTRAPNYTLSAVWSFYSFTGESFDCYRKPYRRCSKASTGSGDKVPLAARVEVLLTLVEVPLLREALVEEPHLLEALIEGGPRGRGGGPASGGSGGRGTGGAQGGARQTGTSRTPSPAAGDVRPPSKTPEPEPQNRGDNSLPPSRLNSPARADQGLASFEMPSSDPLTPLPEFEDVEMHEGHQKDDGHSQNHGDEEPVTEPRVEREHEDDAVGKVVEGGNAAGDQDGDGASLAANNGDTGNAKGVSHQISHQEEDITDPGKIPSVNFARKLTSM